MSSLRYAFTDDDVARMVAMYETDQAMTFAKVARAFGCCASRVQQLLRGRVTPRIGGRRKSDGTPPKVDAARIPGAPVPQLFATQVELVRRREETVRKLDRDPAVLLYRRERARAARWHTRRLNQIKRDFHAQLERAQHQSGLTVQRRRRA